MASMTKAQLAAENATLRAELSALRTQIEAMRAPKPQAETPQTIKKTYPSTKDAMAACKEYAQSKFNQRYIFTVCGSELIAKLRSAS